MTRPACPSCPSCPSCPAMTDSPGSAHREGSAGQDQGPEDLRSDTTKKKSAGSRSTVLPSAHVLSVDTWPRVVLCVDLLTRVVCLGSAVSVVTPVLRDVCCVLQSQGEC